MNPIATSETTSRQKRVRTDPTAGTTTIDLTTPAPTPKTTRSPRKSAIQALEGATALLPTSLHPLVLHFGNRLISIRAKRITKENIAQRMTRDPTTFPNLPKHRTSRLHCPRVPQKMARESPSSNSRSNKLRIPKILSQECN